MKYDNAEYAASRLIGTYVMYGSEPALITDVDGDPIVAHITVCGIQEKALLTDLKLTGHKLGYINTSQGAVYIERVPKREDWRQGLRTQNVTGVYPSGMARRITDAMLIQAMKPQYPTIEEALGVLKRGERIAFSRQFAFDKDDSGKISLYFRNSKKVATLSNGLLSVAEQFSYLKGSIGVACERFKG